MRMLVRISLVCLFMLAGVVNAAMAAGSVVIEGPEDKYPHYLDISVAPFIEDGTILVPLRDIAEELGFQIAWDPKSYGISLQGNGKLVDMEIGSRIALINSASFEIDAAPRIKEERTMIPLQFISGGLGYHVEYSDLWNNSECIFITPYSLISDAELLGIKIRNFDKISDPGGPAVLKLKPDGVTPSGMQVGSSIRDVLQVYGVPQSPERSLNYSAEWSGKLIYWGTFIPQSDGGTFWEFTFDHGALIDLTISG
ncbi:MAG: copper amine oxidase N-terminal domain-containing protein [Syntrophomonas sp.]